MMEVSKIHLSSAEMELMQNAEIILTKNRILEKMKSVLETVQLRQLSFEDQLQSEIFSIHPKISKGEYYEGLPYLILDYPRRSSGESLFFIRTMFWWGHYFSSTLQIAGDYKNSFLNQINSAYDVFSKHFVGVSQDPWVHRIEDPYYRRVSTLSKGAFAEVCQAQEHIKLVLTVPLTDWERAGNQLFENWKLYLSVCGLIT